MNFSSYLEKLSSLLMTAGRMAPHYEMMAELYPQSKDLQSHLSEYFLVVVRLCHEVLKFTQKRTITQIASTLSDSILQNFRSELDIWANTIKEDVRLLMAKRMEEEAQDNSRFRALWTKSSKSASHHRKLKAKKRVLDYCSTYEYQTAWKQTRKIGNSTIFRQNEEYCNWKNCTASRTLVYMGKLGSGKSVLLANIVDDLNLSIPSANTTVAYFFCRHNIPESLQALAVVSSLARQLLSPIQDLSKVDEWLNIAPSPLDFDRIFNILQLALPQNHKVYFVLDGLDECDRPQREILTQQLQTVQKIFPTLLCVSLRVDPDNALGLNLTQFTAPKSASIPDENPDIETFIGAELERSIESGRLVIGHPAIILEILEALLQRTQGMFLWVALQIQSLCTMKSDQEIRDALTDLPKDLSETFSRILKRSDLPGQSYQRRVLELVSIAHRPLTTKELREALSVVPGDTVWNPARLLNDVYSVLAGCGCLLVIDEEELTVRLVHHSVKQFLCADFKDSTNLAFNSRTAHRTMAHIIITYLSYGVFDTRLSTGVIPQIMAGSVPSAIINSTIDSSSILRNNALKLLRLRKQPNFNVSKTLTEANKLFNSPLVDEFYFLSYAKLYWSHHITFFSVEPATYNLLGNLIIKRTINMDTTDEASRMLLLWACENGHVAVVKELLGSSRVDIDYADSKERTPLHWACQNGHVAVVKELLRSRKVDVNHKDRYGETPLFQAINNRDVAVIKELLGSPRVDVDHKDIYRETLLFQAINNRDAAVVKELLDSPRVDVNTRDMHGGTPLFWAINNRDVVVVKELLDSPRVDVNTRDMHGETPLFWAINSRDVAVVKALLKSPRVGVNDEDMHGETPLSIAINTGDTAIVKQLINTDRVDINYKDSTGKTPLWKAIQIGNVDVINVLLDSGRVDANDLSSMQEKIFSMKRR